MAAVKNPPKAKIAPPKIGPKAKVISPWERWSADLYGGGVYQPSALAKKGTGGMGRFKVMEDVWRRDPLVRTYLRFYLDALCSGEIRVKAPENDPHGDAQERTEFTECMIHKIRDDENGTAVGLVDALMQTADAARWGVSCNEMIVYPIPEGEEYAGLYGCSGYRQIHPKTIDFAVDDYGRLLPDGLLQFPDGVRMNPVRLDPKYFVIYSHEPLFGNLWGTSLIESVYAAAFARDVFHRALNVFIERLCLGNWVSKYPSDWDPEDPRIDDLLAHLERLRGNTNIAVPDDIDFEIKDAPPNAFRGLMEALTHYSTEIGIGIGIPLLLFSVGPAGSYALANVQFRALQLALKPERARLARAFTDQMIRQYVFWNFGPGPVPTLEFGPIDVEDLKAKAEEYLAIARLAGMDFTPEALAREFNLRVEDMAKRPDRGNGDGGDQGDAGDAGDAGDTGGNGNGNGDHTITANVYARAAEGRPERWREPNPRERRIAFAEREDRENADVGRAAARIAGVVYAERERLKDRVKVATEGLRSPLA